MWIEITSRIFDVDERRKMDCVLKFETCVATEHSRSSVPWIFESKKKKNPNQTKTKPNQTKKTQIKMNIECYRELSPFVDHETIFMLANTNGCAAVRTFFKKIFRSTFGKQILAGLLADPKAHCQQL